MRRSSYDLRGRRVYVAGHNGMVGSALVRRLAVEDCEILLSERGTVDLRRQSEAEEWIAQSRPQAVFVAAARVGGILANDTRPAEFLYDNLMIEANLIEAAKRCGVEKLLFLGSSCVYPKITPQPIREDALLTGALEPTNQWYAIAKIAGIKLARAYRLQYGCDFVSVMPSNLYGPNDTYDLNSSHVIPALFIKAHLAKRANAPTMEVWGTGEPRREFLHVDDLADACVFAMKHYSGDEHLNIGSGSDVTIRELAEMIGAVVGYEGELTFDASKPDGTPRKLMDVSRIAALGWKARIPLREGLSGTYRALLDDKDRLSVLETTPRAPQTTPDGMRSKTARSGSRS